MNISPKTVSYLRKLGYDSKRLNELNMERASDGAVTLEILGLVLNPFNRTLQPMRMLLA